MILLILGALCLLSVPLTGGSLRNLSGLRLRWLWLAPLGVIAQTVIVSIAPGGDHALHAALHVLSYVPIVAFLWANRAVAGVPIVGIGTLLNLVAILANGGVMPASARAERLAGMDLGSGFHNSTVVAHPHLLWLGDIIPVPWPLPNVLSVGDCVLYAGLLVLLHRAGRNDRAAAEPGPAILDT